MQTILSSAITAKNLTAEVLVLSYNVGAITSPRDVRIDLLLGRTGGLLAGAGATYTITVELVRTVAGTATTFRLPAVQYVLTTAAASRLFPLTVRLESQDTLKVYARSSSAFDTAVLGYAWLYDTAMAPEAVLAVNIDSTGGTLSAAKAIEAILAVLAGNATFDAATGVESFRGRNGTTPVVTLTLSGNGTREDSTVL